MATTQNTLARCDYVVQPGGRLTGAIQVPGDKSISHRALMLGSLAEGVTEVTGLLEGEDVLSTLAAFRAMGVNAVGPQQRRLTIHGAGLRGLKAPASSLDMGNSGTAMRLLAGMLAGQAFDSVLIGDDSLSKRPMTRVTEPLNRMGASIMSAGGGRPPLKIKGAQALHGIEYPMPLASAQVKSAILLAGLYADGETEIREPAVTRDHTERMLEAMGVHVDTSGDRIKICGGQTLKGCRAQVPADLSSAAFVILAALIAENADVLIPGVGVNPTRTGAIDILQSMGGDITLESVVGEGSTFTLSLPASVEAVADDTSEENAQPSSSEHPVLIIDDNADSRDVLRRTLEADGHAVATAPAPM